MSTNVLVCVGNCVLLKRDIITTTATTSSTSANSTIPPGICDEAKRYVAGGGSQADADAAGDCTSARSNEIQTSNL